MKDHYDIKGMSCTACSGAIERALNKLDGVKDCKVSLVSNDMTIIYDEAKVDDQKIKEVVEKLGYEAYQGQVKVRAENHLDDEFNAVKKRIKYSTILMIILMYIAMGSMFKLPLSLYESQFMIINPLLQAFLSLFIILINKKYFISGSKAFIHKSPNMDSLVMIGVASSYLYSFYHLLVVCYEASTTGLNHSGHLMEYYFESAGMILTLVTVGKYLEAKSKLKTSQDIESMMSLKALNATVLVDGKEEVRAIEQVRLGDLVVVKPGEMVPLDGIIVEGESYFDLSSINGETLAVHKELNDEVIASTINKTSKIVFKVTKLSGETRIDKIIELVKEASNSRASYQKLADTISKYFVPVIILISILTLIVWLILGQDFNFAFLRAVSVLVISCPCALGLATPLSITVAIGKASKANILIKDARSLEEASKADYIIFDKTGTLTKAKMQVVKVETKLVKEEFLEILASLEANSIHPLSSAIKDYYKAKEEATDFLEIAGKGVVAKVNGKTYLAGNKKLLADYGIEVEAVNGTVIYLANLDECLGYVLLEDEIKEDAKEVIAKLNEQVEVIMLTGDNQASAKIVSEKLGIKTVYSEVSPEDKYEVVKGLVDSGKKVIMVGDGINDSVALSYANVSVSFNNASDIASTKADVILLNDNLIDLVNLLNISKKTVNNIKLNLFYALIYNVLLIPVAFGSLYGLGILLTPMMGSLAMSLSSLFVVTNALRLRKIKLIKKEVKMMEKVFIVDDMACMHCVKRISAALDEIGGLNYEVVLDKKQVIVKGEFDSKTVIDKVTEAGYTIHE